MLLPLRFSRFWLVGGLAMMVIVLLGTLTPLSTRPIVLLNLLDDKSAHLFAFAVLMLWFCGVFRLKYTPLVAVGLVLFGLLIEWLQSLVPYRSAEFADLLFDGGGIVLVFAGLPPWSRTAMRLRSTGCRPIAPSMLPRAASKCPHTNAR